MVIDKPKGVLFDLDGVITTLENNLRAWRMVLKAKVGIKMKDKDWYELEGKSPEEIAEAILAKYDVKATAELITEIAHLKQKAFNKISEKRKVELYPNVEKILSYLKKHNIKIGLVTGSILERVKRSLPVKLFRMFDAVVTADDKTLRKKPYPDPFLNGAVLLGLSTSESWVVENAPLGIISAKAAGCYCIALTTTLSKKELLEADKVIKTHKELLKYFRNIFTELNYYTRYVKKNG